MGKLNRHDKRFIRRMFGLYFYRPLSWKWFKAKTKELFVLFHKWKAKFDKKTVTFDKLYIGLDRRRKNRDVIIESLKINGVEYIK